LRFVFSIQRDLPAWTSGPGSFIGTNGWTRVEQTVRVPEATKLLEIQVIRKPTIKFENKVSGTAWIDDVSLSRIE
jgi:hypothetical protein